MPFSRRRFLAATSVAVAGSTFGPLAQADDASKKPAGKESVGKKPAEGPYLGWPIGIQSYTLRKFSALEAVRHAQGLGLEYMEFYGAHYPTDSADAMKRMKTLLGEAGIKANAHGVNAFTKNHDANRRLFEFAKAAGIKNLTADPQPDSFDSLDKLCDEYKIRICIHNHGPGARYDKLESVTSAVKDHHPLVGACIDTGHVLRSGEDPVKWAYALGPRVFALHMKDVAEMKARTHDVVIGTAHLKLVELFQALAKIGFPADGSLSLEYESNPDNPIEDVKLCLAAAGKAIRQAQPAS